VGISNAISLAAGWKEACAVLSNGAVDCWGANTGGELGIGQSIGPQKRAGSAACGPTRVRVAGVRDAVAIASGESDQTCVLLSTGAVDSWGDNGDGEVGDGHSGEVSTVPVPVKAISRARASAVGNGSKLRASVWRRSRVWGQRW
jgi:alpha-tubulin suppressor-like RCC1 family protein